MPEELDLTNRETLIASIPKNGVGAEIGVAGGYFSEKMLTLAQPRLLYLVDAWTMQSVDVIGSDISNISQEVHDAHRAATESKFKGMENVVIINAFSVDAARDFNDVLDWVYIDANHLRVVEDIEAWLPNVRSGGWVMGHDYTVAGDFITVKRDVDDYIRKHPELRLFVTHGGDQVFERNYPSWAFRKP